MLPEDFAWGQTKRAIKSRVVVLDPPLAKTLGPDTMQVEWFGALIDDAATTEIWSELAAVILLTEFACTQAPFVAGALVTVPIRAPVTLTCRAECDAAGTGNHLAAQVHQTVVFQTGDPTRAPRLLVAGAAQRRIIPGLKALWRLRGRGVAVSEQARRGPPMH